MSAVKIACFTRGTFPSMDGKQVTFTDEMLREMERNTNYLKSIGVLTPVWKYDHPVWGDTTKDAHGHSDFVQFEDGVFFDNVAQPSERFKEDVKQGRRLRHSPEFFETYKWVDRAGQPKELHNVYVGSAILGADRQAIRSERIVPLNQLQFGEGVSDVDAYYLREKLRTAGVVSHTLAEDVFAFAEIVIDPKTFSEEKTTMTDAEIQAMIASGIATAVAPLKAENATLAQKVTDQAALITQQATSFSEKLATLTDTAQRKANVHACRETVQKGADGKDNPRLTGANLDRLENEILMHAAVIGAPDLDKSIRAFVEAIPGIFVTREIAGKRDANGNTIEDPEDIDDGKLPKVVAAVLPKHFADIRDPKNEQLIGAAMPVYFSTVNPAALKGIENNPEAQLNKFREFVTTRVNGADVN